MRNEALVEPEYAQWSNSKEDLYPLSSLDKNIEKIFLSFAHHFISLLRIIHLACFKEPIVLL